jgi:hypothetical protein
MLKVHAMVAPLQRGGCRLAASDLGQGLASWQVF